jgi:hypothetical protein
MIGRKLGASGRNLDRYLKVLKTPKEVQDAFSQGKLSLVEAGKVAGLSGESQAAIQAAIRSGKKAKEVVQEALKRKASGRQKQRQLRNQARLLLRTLTSLEETANSPDGLDTEVIELLECAKTRLNALLADSEARGS